MGEERKHSRCLVCGRKLKNPECIRIGMGRKCKQKQSERITKKVTQLELF